jgi:hypothetical protein
VAKKAKDKIFPKSVFRMVARKSRISKIYRKQNTKKRKE